MSAGDFDASWRAWIAENLAAGHETERLVTAMVAAGHDREQSTAAINDIAASTDLAMVAELIEQRRRREAIIELQHEIRSQPDIDVLTAYDPTHVLTHYVHGNRPALLRGFASAWPALSTWSLPWFATTFGATAIDVCTGRDRHQTPDRDYEELVTTTTIAEFVRAIDEAGVTNDLYAISNNKLMTAPELQCLFDDITPDPVLFPPDQLRPGSVALWLGPAGTITPLHHDTTNVMLTQIQGRKRVTLASPLQPLLADNASDFYAETDVGSDLWHKRYGDVTTHTVDVGPGDALLIPAGWWHRVEALDPSISFVLLGFATNNDFSWYRPGSIRT